MKKAWHTTLMMFLWLSVGYGIVHGSLVGFSINVINTARLRSIVSEHPIVTKEGDVILESWSQNRPSRYRRLDGSELPATSDLKSVGGFVFPSSQPREPESWRRRIQSFYDIQNRATCWYLIAPPDGSRSAYFEGYDPLSHQLIGYLSLAGFSSQLPPREKRFSIEPRQISAFYGNTTSINSYGYNAAFEPGPNQLAIEIPADLHHYLDQVWILSQGTIYEIRLGSRTVRPLLQNRPDLNFLTNLRPQRSDLLSGRSDIKLVANSATGVVFIDPNSGDDEKLPLDLTSNDTLYPMSNGKYVVWRRPHVIFDRNERTSVISWFDKNGVLTRREELELGVGPNHLFNDIAGSLVAPSFLVSTAAIALSMIENGQSADAPPAGQLVWQLVSRIKFWLLSSLTVGLVCAWACRQREREVFGSTSWFWPIMVGLFGWFGWMGYICVRPLPARLPNRQWLPAQPEPVRPMGIEIFA